MDQEPQPGTPPGGSTLDPLTPAPEASGIEWQVYQDGAVRVHVSVSARDMQIAASNPVARSMLDDASELSGLPSEKLYALAVIFEVLHATLKREGPKVIPS